MKYIIIGELLRHEVLVEADSKEDAIIKFSRRFDFYSQTEWDKRGIPLSWENNLYPKPEPQDE